MQPLDKRDFREETALNSAEYALLKTVAGTLGLSKSAALRFCLHRVGDEIIRAQQQRETGLITE